MRFVFALAFRKAGARLLLFFGLLTLLFTVIARGGLPGPVSLPGVHSPWDYPIAIDRPEFEGLVGPT